MARVRCGYTQNEEEKFILEAFKDFSTGRFLDIGAHDGKTFSSTRALIERGWVGVYVEPAPDVLPSLRENTKEFEDRVTIVPCAIGLTSGVLPFYSAGGDMVGSLSAEHAKKWSSAVTFSEIHVPVITLAQLESRVGHSFDFINLDVEGINWDLFCQFDWTKWTPRCVCIEYDDKRDAIIRILQSHGYSVVYISAENIVAVRY
jgi:FkbM family methyltransferase